MSEAANVILLFWQRNVSAPPSTTQWRAAQRQQAKESLFLPTTGLSIFYLLRAHLHNQSISKKFLMFVGLDETQ